MDKSYSMIEQAERKRGQYLGAEERGSIQQLKRLGYHTPKDLFEKHLDQIYKV